MKSIPKHFIFPDNGWEATYNPAPPTMFKKAAAESLVLPDPPWAATASEADDVAALHYLRPDAYDAILRELDPPYKELCQILDCTYKEGNAVYKFMEAVLLNTDWAVYHSKKHFMRARPYHVNTRVRPMFSRGERDFANWPAYPSGHSTQTHTLAMALVALDKSREYALLTFAYQVGRNREIAGLHFASDTIVGVHFASLLLDLMKPTDEYQKLFNAAQEEVNAQRTPVAKKKNARTRLVRG